MSDTYECEDCGAVVSSDKADRHDAWHELVELGQLRLMIQRIVKEEAQNFNLSAAHKVGMMRYIEDGLDSLPDTQDERCRFGVVLQDAVRKLLRDPETLRLIRAGLTNLDAADIIRQTPMRGRL